MKAGIIWLFFVLPIPAGCALVALAGVRGVTAGGRFAGADWLGQVAWCGLLGLGLMTAIPAAGWQELRRRRREAVSGARNASKPIR